MVVKGSKERLFDKEYLQEVLNVHCVVCIGKRRRFLSETGESVARIGQHAML